MQMSPFGLFRQWTSLLLAFVSFAAVGQPGGDSALLSTASGRFKDLYYRSLGPELHLYSGVSYKEFKFNKNDEGQPYFESREWVLGDVFYNGILFEGIPMIYDVVNDQVVIDHKYGRVKMGLISEKVSYFVIGKHRFVRLEGEPSLKAGFYELVFDGTVKCYAKWKKNRIEAVKAREMQVQYEDQNRYYILKDNRFYNVKSKASVMDVLKDKRPTLQKDIRKYHLNFRRQRIEAISKTLALYESTVTP
jgi:hypothetical protein